MIGKLLSKETLILRLDVGEAELIGMKYELSLSGSTNAPIVRSKQTGKFWIAEWSDLVRLAREAGIDEEDGGAS